MQRKNSEVALMQVKQKGSEVAYNASEVVPLTNLSANDKKQSSAPPLRGETKRIQLNGTSEVMLRISEVFAA